MKSVPYWHDTAAPFEAKAHGPVSERADAVVIGAGFTGLSAAIARKGAEVTLFEKDRVVASASGRNGGMCTPGLVINFRTAVERYGLETAKTIFLSYNAAIDLVEKLIVEEKIECEFKRTGKLSLASKPITTIDWPASTRPSIKSNTRPFSSPDRNSAPRSDPTSFTVAWSIPSARGCTWASTGGGWPASRRSWGCGSTRVPR